MLKLKFNINYDEMSVKITPINGIVRTGLASIVIYRVLQFIFKAIGILLFFWLCGANLVNFCLYRRREK